MIIPKTNRIGENNEMLAIGLSNSFIVREKKLLYLPFKLESKKIMHFANINHVEIMHFANNNKKIFREIMQIASINYM